RAWDPSLPRRRACGAGTHLRLSPPARPVRRRLRRAGRWKSRGTELRRRHDTYGTWSAVRTLPRPRPDLAARLRVGLRGGTAGPEEIRRIPAWRISAFASSPNELTFSIAGKKGDRKS